MTTKIKLTFILLFFCSYGFAQNEHYRYKRELSGVKDGWHKIILPDDIFGKVSSDLRDIRIFGSTSNNDTIEAPYIIHVGAETALEKDASFHLINQTKNGRGYYFTFAMLEPIPVNQITPEFKQQNFDWRIGLEGSHNQQEWFSIVEDYRILSIKNELTDFKFTRVIFPDSKYRYYRLLVHSEVKPELVRTKVVLNESIKGNYRNYPATSTRIEQNKLSRQTIIDIELNSPVPVSNLKFSVKDTFDYYRPITIKYLADSFKTEQGWKYNYSTLTSGTLNSIDQTEWRFKSTLLKHLQIVIDNHNNEPLRLDSMQIYGYVHELIARFNAPATYYLAYGNSMGARPLYDIDRFTDKIPGSLESLSLGNEQLVAGEVAGKAEPLFRNKIWLWVIIGFTMIVLGWFSLSMMRQR